MSEIESTSGLEPNFCVDFEKVNKKMFWWIFYAQNVENSKFLWNFLKMKDASTVFGLMRLTISLFFLKTWRMLSGYIMSIKFN